MTNTVHGLIDELKNRNYQSVAILGHTSIDPDSYASSYGIAFIVQQLKPEISIDIFVDGISTHTKKLIEFYEGKYLTNPIKQYDLIIIVDVNVKAQLGKLREFIEKSPMEKIIIIDHHTPTEFSKKVSYAYIDDEKSSTVEIIVDMMKELAIIPSNKLLTVLLSGIIYDSRRFFSLDKKLLGIISYILDNGGDYNKAIYLLQKQYEFSERIARLKCASRIRINKINEWIIVWSKVRSHEGSSARGILSLGADVALIFTKRKKLTRLTVRATNYFYKETGFNFGSMLMQPLGEEFNGDGGGHSTAAALTINTVIQENELMEKAFKILTSYLKKNS